MTIDLDEFRELADDLRPLAETIRTVSVVVRTRTWSGGSAGLGTPTDSDLELPGYVKVRQLSAKEVAGSGGRYRDGDVEIGPITPPYTTETGSGGTSAAQLRPAVPKGSEVLYVLTGELSGEFRLVELDTSNVLSYKVRATRLRGTP